MPGITKIPTNLIGKYTQIRTKKKASFLSFKVTPEKNK